MTAAPRPLDATFFARDTLQVAHDLVGVTLRCGVVAGTIVETEAYTDDAASHFLTRRHAAAIMGSTHARLYVYRIYGVHDCLNVTTDTSGPGAVLLRALRPTEGLETMRRRRADRCDRELASGPGRLSAALGIDASWNGRAFDDGLVWTAATSPTDVAATPRIGISQAADLPWRFVARDDPFLSRRPRRSTLS